MDNNKDRIRELEDQNRIIALENEELRKGALESVKIMQSAELLQKETEFMSIELAEKAI